MCLLSDDCGAGGDGESGSEHILQHLLGELCERDETETPDAGNIDTKSLCLLFSFIIIIIDSFLVAT